MDSDSSDGSSGSGGSDFGFAFNDSNFSDRVLSIEIIPDPKLKIEIEDVEDIVYWARKRKRRREEMKENNDAKVDMVMQREEQAVNCDVLEMEDGLADDEREEEEAVGMLEELPSAIEMTTNPPGDDEASEKHNSSTNMDSSKSLHVRTLHISSPILAAKSRFFYKVFSNGMKESEQRHVTIQIHASEEAGFMDLLKFMYSNTLTTTRPTVVLDLLMAADKFEVKSCMRYCSRLLWSLRMTCESALLYLELPFNILMADEILPLTDAAKQFLALRFRDITKFQEEVLDLPLVGIEVVLSSDDLQIASEDAVYDFALKWARIHYPKPEKRREIWKSHLCHLIRFPCMTCRKLKKVLTCNEFDSELASKLVFEALFYKAEAPYRQRSIASEAGKNLNYRYVERAYKYRPIKAVEFEKPGQQCVIYLDLKRDEVACLFPGGRVYSEAFHLGGQGFFLSANCNMDQQGAIQCFGLFLGMQEKGSVSCPVDYKFAVRTSQAEEEYVSKYKGNYTFTSGKAVGCRNLFGVSWSAFLGADSIYFINGILHLRAELTVRE
ncbi:BTB/POZ domain-containing protein POB1-like [Lycium barbarum]|uniref:BTB/POZ domain-containing protein POB1-like n=1 Tax=Lycium barbarum TaxID=112863 RepID=UPI00293ECB87|nr:BTB/POZ domain-containing protein POB1-like [Lycium barbarum]XP_060206915.1 BTB/POZ domain-containing protein POB1-like [Lycium barbarum]